MSALLTTLSIDQLAQCCRQETNNFSTGQAYDDAYGLELFRRAIFQHNQAAWQAIYVQYQPLVAYWVQRHSKFPSTGEEADFFVNAAFTRFWWTASRHRLRLRFESLGRVLRYLKVCVHTAIEDECRRQRGAQATLSLDDLSEIVANDLPSTEAQVMRQVAIEVLTQAMRNRLEGEEEEVVALLSWKYGLRPREIQARRPDLFPSVKRIYQIKRNISNRLMRDPLIQQLRAAG